MAVAAKLESVSCVLRKRERERAGAAFSSLGSGRVCAHLVRTRNISSATHTRSVTGENICDSISLRTFTFRTAVISRLANS